MWTFPCFFLCFLIRLSMTATFTTSSYHIWCIIASKTQLNHLLLLLDWSRLQIISRTWTKENVRTQFSPQFLICIVWFNVSWVDLISLCTSVLTTDIWCWVFSFVLGIFQFALEGNALKAIELTEELAPELLEQNKDLHFDLLSLHFVKLVRSRNW